MPANVHITQDTAHAFSESDISINAANLNQIIAGSNTNTGASTQAQYYSSDGGQTWGQSSLPLQTADTFCSDPAVGWTSDGTAWALTIGVGANFTVRSYKSTNGGEDWTFDSDVSGSESPFADFPKLWIDRSAAHRDNMYAIWHENATAFVSVRQGPGGSWSTPLAVSGSETTFTADGADVKTNGAGDVFAFWPNAGGQTLLVAKSTDAGSSFGALSPSPVQIAATSGKFTIKVPAQSDRLTGSGSIGCLIYISGGAYRSASDDLVFACWADLGGGSGCNAPSDAPGGDVTSTCKTRIWFARSLDGGQTWQAAVKINDQASLNDQFFPRLVVDETTGDLAVVYYDTVNDPNRVSTDVWTQSSVDGGATWGPAVQVTTAATDEAVSPEDSGQEFGDYLGLTGYGGRYFACWTDRRSGGDEQIFGAPVAIPECELLVDKGTFGQDEVAEQAVWPSAYWLAVQGFTNESLGFNAASDLSNPPNPAPSVSVSIDAALNPGLTASQISTIHANLPTVNTLASPILAADPSLTAEMQTFLYPYTVSFSGNGAFAVLNPHQVAVLTLHASLTVGPITVRKSAPIELAKGEDPYFTDVDPLHPTAFPAWLSYDLRFFKVTPDEPHEWFSVPNPADRAGAVSYIQTVLQHLNDPSLITNGDTFEDSLVQDEDQSALEFLPADSSHNPTLNFAVARVRIRAATATTIDPVRVFFRLFQAASTVSNFAEVGTGQGTYRWGSDGTPGHTIPLLGVERDQHGNPEYVTIPCFASDRVNLNSPADMKTQTDPPNARSITTVAGGEVDTYFGCWLDINQPDQTFLPASPPVASSDWDGPWTGTQSINSTITAAPHQCLIGEIRFDDTPIPAGATYSTSDKLAQRNIAWIDGPNPGISASRVMPHPFEVRATSPGAASADELMITWGRTPATGMASIYLPAADASEVIRLANTMYRTHPLRAVDGHTIECPTRGVTLIPVPSGQGRYAGLLSVKLPPGVRRGDVYDIVVRQLTRASARLKAPPQLAVGRTVSSAEHSTQTVTWRRLIGTFQVTLTIKVKHDVLYPEERLLAWLKWRVSTTPHEDRWYPVLRQYAQLVTGRVEGFGGNPGKIKPSQFGDVPEPEHHAPIGRGRDEEYTGKVIAIVYDRFGEYAGFSLLTEAGHEWAFAGREREVEALVTRAWLERITITILVDAKEPKWPARIILRRTPNR